MVEAAIDSLENQARQAKLFQDQQKHLQPQVLHHFDDRLTLAPPQPGICKLPSSKPQTSQESQQEDKTRNQDQMNANCVAPISESLQKNAMQNLTNGTLSQSEYSVIYVLVFG